MIYSSGKVVAVCYPRLVGGDGRQREAPREVKVVFTAPGLLWMFCGRTSAALFTVFLIFIYTERLCREHKPYSMGWNSCSREPLKSSLAHWFGDIFKIMTCKRLSDGSQCLYGTAAPNSGLVDFKPLHLLLILPIACLFGQQKKDSAESVSKQRRSSSSSSVCDLSAWLSCRFILCQKASRLFVAAPLLCCVKRAGCVCSQNILTAP